MKKFPAIFNKGILKILRESFSLYFKNIFRLVEIAAWICIPASIFFVLIFYWGLPEQMLHVLGILSWPSALVLGLLLNTVLIKTIQAIEEGKAVETRQCLVSTVSVYAAGLSVFPRYAWVLTLVTGRVLLWSLPFLVSYFILFRIAQSGGPPWLVGLSLVFLVPVFVTVCYYSFSFLAFLVDGIKGKSALVESKKMIKSHFWKFLGNVLALSFFIVPVSQQIFFWIDRIPVRQCCIRPPKK